MSNVDWGARSLALLSISFHAYQFWRDRPHISVTWKFSADAYAIVATNDGKKPVTTKWVKIYSREGRAAVLPGTGEMNMQKRLAPSEQATVMVFVSFADVLLNAAKIAVLDSKNREWELEELEYLREHCGVVRSTFFRR